MHDADEQGAPARIDPLDAPTDARLEAIHRRFDALALVIREGFDDQRRLMTDGFSSVWREIAALRRDMATGFATLHDRLDAFIQVQTELNRRFVDHLERS